MSEGFGREARLRSRSEFTAVQKTGRRAPGRFLTLLGQPNDLERDRLGIIASRKVGNAVIRNRAKRRVREIFRRIQDPNGRTFDLVVIVRRELVTVPLPLVAAEFQAALSKVRGFFRAPARGKR
jgi:ribonuclease P protein component